MTGLSKTLCKEWGPFGVRVNTVAYGWIDTRLTRAKEAGETITVNGKAIALGSTLFSGCTFSSLSGQLLEREPLTD